MQRCLKWTIDAMTYLKAQNLDHTFMKGGNPTCIEQAKALVYLKSHPRGFKIQVFTYRR